MESILTYWKENSLKEKWEYPSLSRYKEDPEFQKPYSEDEILKFKAILFKRCPKMILSMFPDESIKNLNKVVRKLEIESKEEILQEKIEAKLLEKEIKAKETRFKKNYKNLIKKIPGKVIYTEEHEGVFGDCHVISIQRINTLVVTHMYVLNIKGTIEKEIHETYTNEEFLLLVYNENWEDKYNFYLDYYLPDMKSLDDICESRILNETNLLFIGGPYISDLSGSRDYPKYYFIEKCSNKINLYIRGMPDSIIMPVNTEGRSYTLIDEITKPTETLVGVFVKDKNGKLIYDENKYFTIYDVEELVKDIKINKYKYLSAPLLEYQKLLFGKDTE